MNTPVRLGMAFLMLLTGAAVAEPVTGGHSGPVPEYSAVQTIETVPGPFLNRIYVSGDKERQDASLGGMTVTTIIRRDRGVAWLLIPAKRAYQVIDLQDAASASVQALFRQGDRTELGRETLDAQAVQKYEVRAGAGQPPMIAWVSGQGIVVRADIPADQQAGRPRALIRLSDVRVGVQDPALFELPEGYTLRAP